MAWVSEDNLALLSERDLSQWTEAVDEYRSADYGGSPMPTATVRSAR